MFIRTPLTLAVVGLPLAISFASPASADIFDTIRKVVDPVEHIKMAKEAWDNAAKTTVHGTGERKPYTNSGGAPNPSQSKTDLSGLTGVKIDLSGITEENLQTYCAKQGKVFVPKQGCQTFKIRF